MGGNIARRLKKAGHEIVVFDVDRQGRVDKLAGEGMTGRSSLERRPIAKLKAPRSIWVMLPSGKITEDTIMDLAEHMEARATPSSTAATPFYKDDIRRAKEAAGEETSTTSTSAPRAAFGGSSAAIA